MSGGERGDAGARWQRLDSWLWCARFLRQRADCARLAAGGLVRINRQSADKPHARLRIGDTLTLPQAQAVLVIEVLALARRRGPAAEARTLYREIPPPPPVTPPGVAGAGPTRHIRLPLPPDARSVR